MEPMEKFNKTVKMLRDTRPKGQEGSYLFFVGDAQPPNLVLYPNDLAALHYGLISASEVPFTSPLARGQSIQFQEATFVTSNARLAAALTFQPEVIPSQTWYGPVLDALERPKPVVPSPKQPEPLPKRRSSKGKP